MSIWFLTGSQGLYGEDTLRQVAEQSRQIAAQLPVEVEWKPVLTDAAAIRRVMLEANADDDCAGVIAWMHTFSPAKMWIAGLDALRKPLLHLHTQANVALPWSSIDMDFMNLNQARARRQGVRLHPDQAGRPAQDGGGARERSGGGRPHRGLEPGGDRPA
ncbi:hypothetical protein [Nonomuraea dietziae]|uniref:hypothetical protein n=1 Tax=Nonomuraea dietziae TaxID=65515 RepID=UPI0031E17CF0